jgi:hypothetical protein
MTIVVLSDVAKRSQTNSLTNHLYSRMVIGQPEPAIIPAED